MPRPEWVPPPISEFSVRQLADLTDRILACKKTGDDPEPLVAEFNSLAARPCRVADFDQLHGCDDLQDHAATALTPRPQKHDDVTDGEYLEIINLILQVPEEDRITGYWLDFLHINLVNPRIGDLIFWSEREMSAEEILTEARKYKPICL